MPDPGYLVEMIGGVPVVTGPAEIDVTPTGADQMFAIEEDRRV